MSEVPNTPVGLPDLKPLGKCSVTEIFESSSLDVFLKKLDLNKAGQDPELVDTEAKIASLVEKLQDLPTSPPSLYIDLEGVNLSRLGSISILQIYILPLDESYLVDVHTLKEKAFLHPDPKNNQTLLSILESSNIPKVFFDVRNDSDALYSHFNVKLAGIMDLQLMELATRDYSGKFVTGLAKCIDKDAPLTYGEKRAWKASKEKGKKLFAPELGGSYEVFNTRPLPDEIREYCVQDVRFLHKLWTRYQRRMGPSVTRAVMRESANRVKLSQTATYNGQGRAKALAPLNWL